MKVYFKHVPCLAHFAILVLSLLPQSALNAFEFTEPGIYARFNVNDTSWIVRLEYSKAPRTVANFISLAEGTRQWVDISHGRLSQDPLYKDKIFHRVIEDFMIQGGSSNGLGNGSVGFFFKDEFHPDLKHDKAGILSMANRGPNTNGGQFFITVNPTPHLDNVHSVFGTVIDGLEEVIALSKVPTDVSDRPLESIVLKSIDIIRVGEEALSFSHQSLEDSLPNVYGVQNTSLSLSANSVLRLSWENEAPALYTLVWSNNFRDWFSQPMGGSTSIDLLITLEDNSLARMQDFVPENFFSVFAAEPD